MQFAVFLLDAATLYAILQTFGAMLKMMGISIEPAPAAPLLLRDFIFWLPMLPGV